MRILSVLVLTLVIAFTLILYPSYSRADEVLAVIGKKKVTMSDLERVIGYYTEDKRSAIEQNPRNKVNLLRRLVQATVLADLARKEGLEKDPKIKARLSYFFNELLAMEFVREKVINNIKVSEEDIRQYYNANIEKFKQKESVRARHILIKVPENADATVREKARKKAEDLLKRVKAGEDFKKLASEYSEDPGSAKKGGDLGYFTRGRMVKPFEDAAFSLKPGEVSGIVKTKFGYHIIKVLDKKPGGVMPLDAVRGVIKKKVIQELTRSGVRDFIEKAMKDEGVKIYSEKLMPQKTLLK